MRLNDDLSEKLYQYRYFIIGFALCVLMFVCFILGNKYACEGGYMSGYRCVKPKYVNLVQVCEYSTGDCGVKCAAVMAKDAQLFYERNAVVSID